MAAAATATAVLLALAPAGLAGYASPTLAILQSGATTVIVGKANGADDPTARLSVVPPTTAAVTTSQPPGTQLGSVRLLTSALDLGGALMPFTGAVVAADLNAVPEATRTSCVGSLPVSAAWVLDLRAVGQAMALPAFVVTPPGAEGAPPSTRVVICTRPPGVPLGTPDRATFGAKLVSVQLTLAGVFAPASRGTWMGVWTPWEAGALPAPSPGLVTPVGVAAGAVTIAATRSGSATVVTGRVIQAGNPRGAAKVDILAGATANALRRVASVRVRRDGSYRMRVDEGGFFRARVVASPLPAPRLCAALTDLPAPCGNPTLGGFTAVSRVVPRAG